MEDIEVLRQRNMQEKQEFLESMKTDFPKSFASEFSQPSRKTERKSSSKKQGNASFRYTGPVPITRRSSARLQNIPPKYTASDLPDPENAKPSTSSDSDLENLEKVIYKPKKVRIQTRPSVFIPVSEVTDEMIENVHLKGMKVYGAGSSSCHQCRQKTVDTKTICRSGFCVGIRGQYCGTCVVNRYGEDPVKALRDPKWKCYCCRGCCNCSFCRAKVGKRPTGILAPEAKTKGFKSVHHLLADLGKPGGSDEGSKGSPDEEEMEPDEGLEGFLLGFNSRNEAVMSVGEPFSLHCQLLE